MAFGADSLKGNWVTLYHGLMVTGSKQKAAGVQDSRGGGLPLGSFGGVATAL